MSATQIVTLNSDGTISISPTSATCQFAQRTGLSDEIAGKEVTISIEFADGTIISTTGAASKSNTLSTILPDGQSQLILYYQPARLDFEFIIQTLSGTDLLSIRAVKLELGSVSTLAMDAAPNYATELLKCQRYFYKKPIYPCAGYITEVSKLYCSIINLPVEMRKFPSLYYEKAIIRLGTGGYAIYSGGSGVAPTNLINIYPSADSQDFIIGDHLSASVGDTNNIVTSNIIFDLELSADL